MILEVFDYSVFIAIWCIVILITFSENCPRACFFVALVEGETICLYRQKQEKAELKKIKMS